MFKHSIGKLFEKAFEETIRLAVTGLSGSGKTVFITSLINQFLHGKPFLKNISESDFIGARIIGNPDLLLREFRYDQAIEKLSVENPSWPESTKGSSSIRLAIRFTPREGWRKKVGGSRVINLDIIDYPGEWLLDLPLLKQSFEEWSTFTLGKCREEPRRTLALEWLEYMEEIPPHHDFDEDKGRKASELYTKFLKRCRESNHRLSFLQPGRFILPGELEGAPILMFCPLSKPENGHHDYNSDSYYSVMQKRYESYKSQVVEKFYREQFARFDRQIVLFDALNALNCGYECFKDMSQALQMIMESHNFVKPGFMNRLFRIKIDRLLFAGTKADHITNDQHRNYEALLKAMVTKLDNNVRFLDIETKTMTVASVKCTNTTVTDYEGMQLPVLVGKPVNDKKGIQYTGQVPDHIPRPEEWSNINFKTIDFLPHRYMDNNGEGLPHIRVDNVFRFLLGDKFES